MPRNIAVSRSDFPFFFNPPRCTTGQKMKFLKSAISLHTEGLVTTDVVTTALYYAKNLQTRHLKIGAVGNRVAVMAAAKSISKQFANACLSNISNIQLWPLAYIRLLNKPYENEVTSREQNRSYKRS